jgi:hypothetical protein
MKIKFGLSSIFNKFEGVFHLQKSGGRLPKLGLNSLGKAASKLWYTK